MIARTWRGTARLAKAEKYYHHFATKVAPQLKGIPGHEGAWLLRRESGDEVEFLAITLWDSIATIQRFTGPDPDVAIVEPEARAVLSAFDDFARHYEVAYGPTRPQEQSL